MNIVFAVNNKYADILPVVLTSILENNREKAINFYILATDYSLEARQKIAKLNKVYHNWTVHYIKPDVSVLAGLGLNIGYITQETYFRYMVADLLPGEDKALYLDADVIVNGNLDGLWQTDITGYYCAGVSDLYIDNPRVNHKPTINFLPEDLYVNAGVLLLNLELMRQDKIASRLIQNTKDLFESISFQDQDIINITLKGHIKELDSIYNFAGENVKAEPHKRASAVIIHYTGKLKAWDKGCKHKLKNIWQEYNRKAETIISKKIKVALLIDEFFGGAGTAFGGYGFLARRYICKYIPDEDIQIDVLLGKGKKYFTAKKYHEDTVDLYRLPRKKLFSRFWLKKQSYDLYLSIELVSDWVLRNEPDKHKKLLLWIQDPRPMYEWDEINTVTLFPESCYYKQNIYDLVHQWAEEGRVSFISQGYFLNSKARDLYCLAKETEIKYLPNPIEIDETFNVATYAKQNKIIFLGRIESVKRGWLFCEIAERMPEYEFYILGQSFREKDKNSAIMAKYAAIPNLHFVGHVDGIEKEQYLKDAKILINTSIHEALPISFLEALSYGTLLVSNRNPEDLTAKFGIWVGDVLGDGFDKVDLYTAAVKKILENEPLRRELSKKAVEYVKERHNVPDFVRNLKANIWKMAAE